MVDEEGLARWEADLAVIEREAIADAVKPYDALVRAARINLIRPGNGPEYHSKCDPAKCEVAAMVAALALIDDPAPDEP